MKSELLHSGGLKAAAALLACVVASLALSPLVFSNHVPAFADNVSFWAPSTEFWTSEIREGRLPLWNPHVLGGIPFAADINHGLFYPPNWIAASIGAARAIAVLALAHVALAAFGMYLFLDSEDVPAPAALWGGLAFALSVSLLSLVNHIVMLESMSWLPTVLFAASRLAKGGGWKTAVLAGAALAASALAGDVHATYITVLAAAAYLAVKCTRAVCAGRAKEAGTVASLFLLAGVTAACLAAAAVLPAFEFARLTMRSEGTRAYASYHALDPLSAVAVVAPGVWGSLLRGTVWSFRWEAAVYLGLPLLILAGMSLKNAKRGIPGLALVVAGAGLAFGAVSPFWHIAYRILPGFASFRQPREYFIIAAVGIILLASHALGDLLTPPPRKRRKPRVIRSLAVAGLAVTVIFLPALFFRGYFAGVLAAWIEMPRLTPMVMSVVLKSAALAGSFLGLSLAALSLRRVGWHGRLTAGFLAAVVLADLSLCSHERVVYGPPELYTGETASAPALRRALSDAPLARFAAVGPGFGRYFERFASRNMTGDLLNEDRTFTVLRRVKACLADNETLFTGLDSAYGYSTFIPTRYSALSEIASGATHKSPVRLRAAAGSYWPLLGVGALLEYSPDYHNLRVHKLQMRPGISLASQWRPAESFADAHRMLKSNPAGALSSPVIEGVPAPTRASPGTLARHSIENVRRSPSTLSLLVHTDLPAMLLIAENNYPGWSVTDNGVPTTIYTANLAGKAVHLAPGKHEVQFDFRPKSVFIGAGVSLAALAVVLFALAIAAVAAWKK